MSGALGEVERGRKSGQLDRHALICNSKSFDVYNNIPKTVDVVGSKFDRMS
jgi:hypothetical protein